MAKRRLVFVVDVKRDRDVLSWWENRGNKSAAIRDLIRKDLKRQGVTLQDIYRAVTELEQKIASGQIPAIAVGEPDSVLEESVDVATAPENLGL